MVKKAIRVECPQGLQPRPIAELVQVASKYESRIYLDTETKHVNAKSIMGMMSLELLNGEEVTVSSDGEDERAAMMEIEDFLLHKFALGA